MLAKNIPQAVLALRGSEVVGLEGAMVLQPQSRCWPAKNIVIYSITTFGDTDFQKHTVKATVLGTFCYRNPQNEEG